MADINPYTGESFVPFFGYTDDSVVEAWPTETPLTPEIDRDVSLGAKIGLGIVGLIGADLLTQHFYNFRHPVDTIHAIADFIHQLI